jgi:hypothetical protein
MPGRHADMGACESVHIRSTARKILLSIHLFHMSCTLSSQTIARVAPAAAAARRTGSKASVAPAARFTQRRALAAALFSKPTQQRLSTRGAVRTMAV